MIHVHDIALSVLLLGAGLPDPAGSSAVMSPDRYMSAAGTNQTVAGKPGEGSILLAAGGKGGEKYLSGKAGGRYGIGGTAGGKKDRK